MMNRAFLSAFAAILLSATLVQTAAAYPSTARRALTTVTGNYRPISLYLTLLDGNPGFDYRDGFYFEALFNGRFSGETYAASGQAGNWRLQLGDGFSGGVSSNNDGNTIYLTSTGPGNQVGRLSYEGGFVVETGILPFEDTPIIGDEFRLFTTASGLIATVVCDDVSICGSFNLTLLQDLEHLGPYTNGVLDVRRVNEECLDGDIPQPCGSLFPLTASSEPANAVPEPATLALIGFGLLGLGLSRRARADRLR